MLPSASPQKRKCSEYRDPDYPIEAGTEPDHSTHKRRTHYTSQSGTFTETATESNTQEKRVQRIREIITREFEREITAKQQTLEQLNERLSQAQLLLTRLRYAIVAEYYKKQELPLTTLEAATMRPTPTLHEQEDAGPQMSLHPSLKKIIGKKPCNYVEILRTCPQRAAAQNAQRTIKSKTPLQRRQERQIQQMIREQGIVIDHSKQATDANTQDAVMAAVTKAERSIKRERNTDHASGNQSKAQPTAGALNAARLNNKVRHLIVVGNTSKYIGPGGESAAGSTQKLSHKWLVYIQAKDKEVPLESYVKKIRFYLHPSYRPNDVVDIHVPPYQLARRGWGEFPLRIQLYFHAQYQQKPVQLVHNLVLDKTLSGMHTLGAETVVEIWLRAIKQQRREIKEEKRTSLKQTEHVDRGNDIKPHKEVLDEQLLEFLNKIGETHSSISADIEKIEPTISISAPLGLESPKKLKLPSPRELMVPAVITSFNSAKTNSALNAPKASLNSPIKALNFTTTSTNPTAKPSTFSSPTTLTATISSTTAATLSSTKTPTNSPIPIRSTPMTTVNSTTTTTIPSISQPLVSLINTTTNTTTTPIVQINRRMPSHATPTKFIITPPTSTTTTLPIAAKLNCNSKNNNNNKIINSNIKLNAKPVLVQANGKLVFTPTQLNKMSATPSLSIGTTTTTPGDTKKILQKKLVQFVDANGKVKYMQMLVATNVPKNGLLVNANKIVTTTTTTVTAMTTTTTRATSMPATSINNNALTTTTTSISINHNNNNNNNDKVNANNLTSIAKREPLKMNMPTPNKNVVFQKEGKLYIIDPLQMKLKQQQKQQVSLLKPQVSLLKAPPQRPTMPSDHNYVAANNSSSATQQPQQQVRPQQKRLPVLTACELQELQRKTFIQDFQRMHFDRTQDAVEYLLRRLPLVVNTYTPATATSFPFVYNSQLAFDALHAIKQRAAEWLRAKQLSRLLGQHQQIGDSSNCESRWSTREILTYARWHAYTPPLKPLPQFRSETPPATTSAFTALVKSEVEQQQQEEVPQGTLTSQTSMLQWSTRTLTALQRSRQIDEQREIIDVVTSSSLDKQTSLSTTAGKPQTTTREKQQSLVCLGVPATLKHEAQLVADICKESGIFRNLEARQPVEESQVLQPLAHTILAQCLHVFIDKLVRHTLAHKQLQQQQQHNNERIEPVEQKQTTQSTTLNARDLYKVITQNEEFDFLTNRHLGSIKCEDE